VAAHDPPEVLGLDLKDDAWELAHAQRVGFCERPIFLVGRNAAGAPQRFVAVRCKARQAAKCVPCALAHQLDARRLMRLGFVEARRSLSDVRWWWLTLTPPGIELTGSPVHGVRPTRRGQATIYLPCSPRPCFACGRPIVCRKRHAPGDPLVGAPFRGHEDCFRYWAVVRWNANVPALWNETMASIRRALRGRPWTLQNAKVVQWQGRGLVHVHAVLRTTASARVVREAAAAARVQGWGWGPQMTLERLAPAGSETAPRAARAISRRIDYLCRYATRDMRVLVPRAPGTETEAHLHRLYEQAHAMALEREAREPQRTAAGLGYGGRILTHSRQWGSSFAQLATERQAFLASRERAELGAQHAPLVWSVARIGWQEGGVAQRLATDAFAHEKPLGLSLHLPPFQQAMPGDEDTVSWWDNPPIPTP
jgi:hypothetical protein